MDVFTGEDDKKLINLVSGYPALYDCSLETYKDPRARDNIWQEIGQKLNKTSQYLIRYILSVQILTGVGTLSSHCF